jgi:ERCC4-type nuclease
MDLYYLTIDVRERELIKLVQRIIKTTPKFNNIQLIIKSMPLGDISFGKSDITPEGLTEYLIIERKSVSDLTASIKDGRYAEQSFRLSGTPYPNHNIIYLIEGSILTPPKKASSYSHSKYKYAKSSTNAKSSIPDGVCVFGALTSSNNNENNNNDDTEKQTPVEPEISLTTNQTAAYSAMFTLNYSKGFSVLRTDSLRETAIFICNSFEKWCRTLDKDTSLVGGTNKEMNEENNNEQSYIDVVKRVKKDNITPDNIGELLLCQFPGVSTASSIAIMRKFTTFINLIHEIERNPETVFDDIYITSSTGRKQKLSKAVKATIISYLQVGKAIEA